MKTHISKKQSQQGSAIMAYFVILMVLSVFIAATGVFVAQTSDLAKRRSDMISALQFAEGAAVIAVNDLSAAVLTNSSGTVFTKMTQIPYATYTLDTTLGGSTFKVYTRTIAAAAPFSSQTVSAQVWITNVSSPPIAKIITTAKVGAVSQTSIVNAKISFGLGAAILSVNDGTSETGASKSVAQDGNITVSAGGKGPTVIYGGSNGLVALANGRVNLGSTNQSIIDIPGGTISQTNYAAGTPIPDYTTQGTSNTLFDISRFIAIADTTPTNAGFAPSGRNHFTNMATFIAAANLYNPTIHTGGKTAMEGVIVVDVYGGDSKGKNADPDMNMLDTKDVLYGINVRGSLIFNFTGYGWDPTSSKIVVTTAINVNAANLGSLVATNPATYTTGYPPTFANSADAPYNIDISGAGYQNFTSGDDLPAFVFSIGVVDMHGPLDICGAMYTPSYIEIENTQNGQTQYIYGEVIMGNGMYVENNNAATTVIALDPNSIDALATAGTAGKTVSVTYWSQ